MNHRRALRIGAVSYLNTRPLVYGLAERAADCRLEFDLPSRLADRLAEGELDVALVPSLELVRNPGFVIISDACIGCRGPVLSVKLLFRKPPAAVETLALDEGSRTSVGLARILLSKRFHVEPRRVPFPLGMPLGETTADAVLMIGDRAIHPPAGDFVEIWDLGAEWQKWTGLPFVFAMWVARPGVDVGDLDAALEAARDDGEAHLEEIAARHAPEVGLSPAATLSYLRDNLYFHLGPEEERGLVLYYRHAVDLGLIPRNWDQAPHDAITH